MIQEVRLPEISENVESGDVIKVLVSVGDNVTVDQPLVELETEKAVLEVPAPYAGVVSEVLVKAGDTIEIDQLIVKIDTAAAASASRAKEAPREAQPSPKTAKKTREKPPAASQSSAGASTPRTPAKTEPGPPAPTASASAQDRRRGVDRRVAPPASPTLRRMARELGVDLDKVAGSGPGGRILKDDLTTYARNVVSGASATQPGMLASENTENTKWGLVVREPMSKVRQVTARTMNEAWTSIPHVTQYDKVDITEMEEIRKQYSKRLEATGGKLTMTAILLKVAASALKVFPQFNASIDMEQKEIVYKRYYNTGVAVDTDRGLLVPVIRAVDKKNISELSLELNAVAERARNKKLTPEEMDGGTFTISNLGGIGGTNFSPIIYPPQVAILGVARARVEPLFTNNQFEPRLMLPICVSYDHRIIDGADGARFLRWIVRALEEPLLLALEG
jgi:pyruvate dehydrogenase E2 component (dihydrolipoamide acetyltransferase)